MKHDTVMELETSQHNKKMKKNTTKSKDQVTAVEYFPVVSPRGIQRNYLKFGIMK